MTNDRPPEYLQLDALVSHPREDLDVEYKGWLDLTVERGKATLAKAAIALANHGGGHIVLGFREKGKSLETEVRPSDVPEVTQDAVNAAIRRYAEPRFQCQLYSVPHPRSSVDHAIVRVPGSDVPVMSKRDQKEAKVSQNRIYVRTPGPSSEEPHTAEEWRKLLDRCIWARREEMLDSIRSIVTGQVEPRGTIGAGPVDALEAYCSDAYRRWTDVVSDEPEDSSFRFPDGHYEMGFSLVGADPAPDLKELNVRLEAARRIKLSGWTPFLRMNGPGWEPYAYEHFVEAWLGGPVEGRIWNDPFHADFWRASLTGELYTIRGYAYDGPEALQRGYSPARVFDVAMPILKVAEGTLFAHRYASEFTDVEHIAIRCKFAGLAGRSLIADAYFPDPELYVCRTPEVVSTAQVTLQQAQDNLPELVHGLLLPLFEKFGFYELRIDQVQTALQQMRRYA